MERTSFLFQLFQRYECSTVHENPSEIRSPTIRSNLIENLNNLNSLFLELKHLKKQVNDFKARVDNMKESNYKDGISSLENSIGSDISSILSRIEKWQAKLETHPVDSNAVQMILVVVLNTIIEEHKSISDEASCYNIIYMKRYVFLSSSYADFMPEGSSIPVFEQDTDDEEENISDEELLVELQQENKSLLESVDKYVSETQRVNQQVNEVSKLLSLFNEKLFEQREMITNIYDDSVASKLNVDKGNEELIKTNNRAKNDIQLFLAYLIVSMILLVYDY